MAHAVCTRAMQARVLNQSDFSLSPAKKIYVCWLVRVCLSWELSSHFPRIHTFASVVYFSMFADLVPLLLPLLRPIAERLRPGVPSAVIKRTT